MQKLNSLFVVLAVLVLSSCATMSSEKGQYAVHGITSDPIGAAAVTGQVNMQQDALKSCIEAAKSAAKEHNVLYDPATCLRHLNGGGGYYNNGPAGYWNGTMHDRGFFYGGVSGFQGSSASAVIAPTTGGAYATKDDLKKVETLVRDSNRVTHAVLKQVVSQQ